MPGTVLTGADTLVLFGFETNYGVEAETTLPFGKAVSITSADTNNNLELLHGVGKRAADDVDVKKFEMSFTAEWKLASAAIFPALFGPKNEDESYDAELGPQPITVAVSTTVGTKNMLQIYTGCLCSEAKCTVDTEGALGISATFQASRMDLREGSLPKLFDAKSIYTFAECDWHVDGVRQSNVSNVEISINNGIELNYEIGTRFAAGYKCGNMEVSASLTHQYDSEEYLKSTFGGDVPQEYGPDVLPCKLVLKSLRGNPGVTFDLKNARINTYGSPWKSGDIVEESLNIISEDLKVTVTGGA